MIGRLGLLLTVTILVTACGSHVATPTQTFPQGPEETPTTQPSFEPLPTPQPRPTVSPGLHVDGMATLLREVDQLADPEHPNHQKENRKFEPLEAGTRVYLVNRITRKKMNFWQVYDGFRQDGRIGWIPQQSNEEPNLQAYQPNCPTDFPLTPESFSALEGGEALLCFGNTELTLAGDVSCIRDAPGDFVVGGASFFDVERHCVFGQEQVLGLYGKDVYELLESPRVDTVSGRYLFRGHFDDDEAQGCRVIPFGTDPVFVPLDAGDAGSIMGCRERFVVSTVISQN